LILLATIFYICGNTNGITNGITYQLLSVKKIVFILIVPVLTILLSCNGGNGAPSAGGSDSAAAAPLPAATPAYEASLPKGRVVDSMMCKDGSQSFAFYLPSYYTVDKAFPVIYFFDPHTHGILPLKMYKDLAEKYGFVIVGSNASKNGMEWAETNKGAKALMTDVWSRIHIDDRRVYTAGFSGGARVASSIAMQDGGVAGVISCAAGFPRGMTPQSKFDHFGLVGNLDFNMGELQQLDGLLEQSGFTHQLLVFDGKHGWAPAEDLNTALLWMQVNAMKEHLQPQNDVLVLALKVDNEKIIAAARSAGDAMKQQTVLNGLVKTLNGLADVTVYQKQLANIESSEAYKKAVVLQQQLQQTEMAQQQEFAQQFAAKDENWWTSKIAELNKKARSAPPLVAQMNQRSLNFLGLISYMNSNHAIETGDLEHAAIYLSIFKKADPKNADQPYLSALYYVKKQDVPHAIATLKDAASMGYSDVWQLLSEPAFSSLHEDAGFTEVVAMVQKNSAK